MNEVETAFRPCIKARSGDVRSIGWRSPTIAPYIRGLSLISYTAELESGSFDYDSLTASCCQEAEPIFEECRRQSYRCWLFATRSHDKDHQAKFPEFSLAGQLRKEAFISGGGPEDMQDSGEVKTWFGLFAVDWTKLADALTWRGSPALVLLSRRDLTGGLRAIGERALIPNDMHERKGFKPVNWAAVSGLVCPEGDVVLLHSGGFDDMNRTLHVFFSAQATSSGVTKALPSLPW